LRRPIRQAARFLLRWGEAELATNAAAIMGMHVLPLDGPECDGLADQMPQGRIFEKSRRAFVPFCRKALWERLATLGGVPIEPAAPKAAKPAARQRRAMRL